jgi:hypothetical protein
VDCDDARTVIRKDALVEGHPRNANGGRLLRFRRGRKFDPAATIGSGWAAFSTSGAMLGIRFNVDGKARSE